VTDFESAVEMSSLSGAWPPVTLNTGETAIGGLRAPRPQPATEGDLQATRQWVERVERLTPKMGEGTSGSGTAAAVAVGIAAIIGLILKARSDHSSGSGGGQTPGASKTKPKVDPRSQSHD
jgi:hypothetical protein